MRLDDELRAAAADLAGRPGSDIVDRARHGAARLAPVELARGDVRGALALLEEHVEIDADVPVSANRREVAIAKRILRRLFAWYVGWLAQQVTLLGGALARYAEAVAERFDELDSRIEQHERGTRREFDALGARVAQLEAIERRRQRDDS